MLLLLLAQELEAAMADGDMPQRKSARSVKRRNFADLEEPPPEDDDSWELGDDSDSERLGVVGGGSRKRRRSSAAVAGGPAEDRRFGECAGRGMRCSMTVGAHAMAGCCCAPGGVVLSSHQASLAHNKRSTPGCNLGLQVLCVIAAGIYDQRRYSTSSKQQRGEEEGGQLQQQQLLNPHPLHLLSLVAPDAPSRGAALVAAAAAAAGNGRDPSASRRQQQQQQRGQQAGGGQQASRKHAAMEAAVAAAAHAAGIPADHGQPGGVQAAAAAAEGEGEEEEEEGREEGDDAYVVECPCGIQYDDGHLMIECEHCKAWAHTACLQAQMVSPGEPAGPEPAGCDEPAAVYVC